VFRSLGNGAYGLSSQPKRSIGLPNLSYLGQAIRRPSARRAVNDGGRFETVLCEFPLVFRAQNSKIRRASPKVVNCCGWKGMLFKGHIVKVERKRLRTLRTLPGHTSIHRGKNKKNKPKLIVSYEKYPSEASAKHSSNVLQSNFGLFAIITDACSPSFIRGQLQPNPVKTSNMLLLSFDIVGFADLEFSKHQVS
jgi:hypothetical protein